MEAIQLVVITTTKTAEGTNIGLSVCLSVLVPVCLQQHCQQLDEKSSSSSKEQASIFILLSVIYDTGKQQQQQQPIDISRANVATAAVIAIHLVTISTYLSLSVCGLGG